MVHECIDRVTGEVFACKSISKSKLQTREAIVGVRREVELMHTLLGVDNCVQLKARALPVAAAFCRPVSVCLLAGAAAYLVQAARTLLIVL